MKRLDLTGKIFGDLEVLSMAGVFGGKTHWLCLCDCGNKTIVQGRHLASGNTRSCGCYARSASGDRLRTNPKASEAADYSIRFYVTK